MTAFLRSLTLVLVSIGSCILATAALAAGPVFPPGSRIGIAPLPAMEPSKRFTGFEDGRGLAFTFIEMPPEAYREVAGGFTAERLKEQGVALGKREELKVGERNAVLVTGEQKAGDVTLRRWFLVVEDPSMTAFVIAQGLPEGMPQGRPEAEIRAALMTIAIRPPLAIEDQVAALPFRLTERAGFRPVRVMAGNALFLTDGPKDVVNAEQPIAILAQSTAPAPSGPQRDAFARAALNANAVFKDALLERAQSFRQKGAEWHEIVARATEIASGTPVVVTQTIRFSPTGYVRMLGVAKVEARDEAMPRFRALFDGVEVEER